MFYPFIPWQASTCGVPYVPLPSAIPDKLAIAGLVLVFPPETLDSDFSRVQWPQQLCCHAVIWLL